MKKIGLTVQINSDFDQFKGDLVNVQNELTKLARTDIDIALKVDTLSAKKALTDLAKMAEERAEQIKKDYENVQKAINNTTDAKMLATLTQTLHTLQAEYNKFTSLAATANTEVSKSVQNIASAFDIFSEKTTAARLGITKELNLMGNSMKELKTQMKSSGDFVDVNIWRNKITEIKAKMDEIKSYQMNHWQTMTEAQKRYNNNQLEMHRKYIETWTNDAERFEKQNDRRAKDIAKKQGQMSAWNTMTTSTKLFASAQQEARTGQMSNIDLNKLNDNIRKMKAHADSIQAQMNMATASGDYARAQELQTLHSGLTSRIISNESTYGSLASKMGTYNQVVAGSLRTSQATEAQTRMTNRKSDFVRAVMNLGGGGTLSDAELSALKAHGGELAKSETALKKKLQNKNASEEELNEVKRHLERIREERIKHGLEMEKIEKRNNENLERARKKQQTKAEKDALDAKNKPYIDLVGHLVANPHLIANMSAEEARDTQHKLSGAAGLFGNDAQAKEHLSRLRADLSARVQDQKGRGPMNFFRSMFGMGRGSAYGNSRLNPFHYINKRVTNVAQMLGTSLYGMGVLGLGSAVLKSTVEKAAEMETAKLTLAGLTNSTTQFIDDKGQALSNPANLMKSLDYSNVLYRNLRNAAKGSLMTTGEMTEAYLTGAPRLRSSGFSETQALEITKKIMMLGRATGLNSTAIMSDIRDFAAGNVNSRSQVLMAAGLSKEGLKQAKERGGTEEMFKYFQEKMSSYTEAFAKIAETPAGKLNAFKIEIEQLQQTMGEKLIPIVIPALEKFRLFISDWVESGQAEKFIAGFGQLVATLAEGFTNFLDFAKPWVSDFNTLLNVTLIGVFAAFATQMAIKQAAMAHPLAAVVTTLGAFVTGILVEQARLDAEGAKTLTDTANFVPNEQTRAKTRQDFVESLMEKGNTGRLDKNVSFYLNNEDLVNAAGPLLQEFNRQQEQANVGNWWENTGYQANEMFKNILDSNYMPNTPLRGSARDFGMIIKDVLDKKASVPYDVAQVNQILNNVYGGDRKKLYEAANALQYTSHDLKGNETQSMLFKGKYTALSDYPELLKEAEQVRLEVYKEMGITPRMVAKGEVDPSLMKKVNVRVGEIMQANAFKNVNKPNSDPEAKEKEKQNREIKLKTYEDVLKAWTKSKSATMDRRVGGMSDLAMSTTGEYLKPIMYGRQLSAGVSEAIAQWKDFVMDNREKGKFAVAEANAVLVGEMQKLKDAYVENIRAVQTNIATQKEQNKSLEENIRLHEKSNEINRAKFELSRMAEDSPGYLNKQFSLINSQYALSMDTASEAKRAGREKINIELMKFLSEQDVLKLLPTQSQDEVRRILMGDITNSDIVPSQVLGGNLSAFQAGVIGSTVTAGGTTSGTSVGQTLKKVATGIKLTAEAVCAEFAANVLAQSGAKISKDIKGAKELVDAAKGIGYEVSASDAQAGDLVYFTGTNYGKQKDAKGIGYHVGIALGGGKYMDASGNAITGTASKRLNQTIGKGAKVIRLGAKPGTSSNAKPKSDANIMSQYTTKGYNPITALLNLLDSNKIEIPPAIRENLQRQAKELDVTDAEKSDTAKFEEIIRSQEVYTGLLQRMSGKNEFEQQQALSLVGLSGVDLEKQKRLNKAASDVFADQELGTKYLKERELRFNFAMEAEKIKLGDKFDKEVFTKQYAEQTLAGYNQMVQPSKMREAYMNRVTLPVDDATRQKLAEITEKVAANLERIAELDFSRFTEAIQNPYGRINSIVNPIQALSTRVQDTMQNEINQGDIDVARIEQEDIKNPKLHQERLQSGYYENLRRQNRATARARAMGALRGGMPEALANQTRNAVGANILNALSTNAYGMFLGGNGVDVGGILSPFMNMMNNKFAQSGDILTALMTGQDPNLNDLQGTPYAQFLIGNTFNRKGARGYATSQMLGRIGGNLAGNYIGGQIFGANANKQAISLGTDLGGMAASAGMLGKAFGGPMGMIAGAVLGSLVGGLFGGKQLSAEEERFRQRQKEHFDRMEKLAEENNKLLRPSYDVYNTIKGDVLYGSSSRWFSSKAYSPLGNQVQLGTR